MYQNMQFRVTDIVFDPLKFINYFYYTYNTC